MIFIDLKAMEIHFHAQFNATIPYNETTSRIEILQLTVDCGSHSTRCAVLADFFER